MLVCHFITPLVFTLDKAYNIHYRRSVHYCAVSCCALWLYCLFLLICRIWCVLQSISFSRYYLFPIAGFWWLFKVYFPSSLQLGMLTFNLAKFISYYLGHCAPFGRFRADCICTRFSCLYWHNPFHVFIFLLYTVLSFLFLLYIMSIDCYGPFRFTTLKVVQPNLSTTRIVVVTTG